MAASAVRVPTFELSPGDLLQLQREQHRHDERNHADIAFLPKSDRLKHYGLHYAKYVGRLAREVSEPKPVERTVVDAALICLSAANTLHQRLDRFQPEKGVDQTDVHMNRLADAAGRFADACEKIDHLEDFLAIARLANDDILRWVLSMARHRHIDLRAAIRTRRLELAERQFYVTDH